MNALSPSHKPNIFSLLDEEQVPMDLQKILRTHPQLLEERHEHSNRTPLLYSMHLAIPMNVTTLLDAGADINAVDALGHNLFHCAVDSYDGVPPCANTLGMALQRIDLESTVRLLAAQNCQGQTPLGFAIMLAAADRVDYSAAINVLLSYGAKLNPQIVNTTAEHLRAAGDVLKDYALEGCWTLIARIRADDLRQTLEQHTSLAPSKINKKM